MSNLVWVEQAQNLHVIRIFRTEKAAFASRVMIVEMDRALAVADIRHQIFLRSNGFCEQCGDIVTEQSGQMHEKKHRGQFGEISLENSDFVCGKTHKREHRKRETRFTRRKPCNVSE